MSVSSLQLLLFPANKMIGCGRLLPTFSIPLSQRLYKLTFFVVSFMYNLLLKYLCRITTLIRHNSNRIPQNSVSSQHKMTFYLISPSKTLFNSSFFSQNSSFISLNSGLRLQTAYLYPSCKSYSLK